MIQTAGLPPNMVLAGMSEIRAICVIAKITQKQSLIQVCPSMAARVRLTRRVATVAALFLGKDKVALACRRVLEPISFLSMSSSITWCAVLLRVFKFVAEGLSQNSAGDPNDPSSTTMTWSDPYIYTRMLLLSDGVFRLLSSSSNLWLMSSFNRLVHWCPSRDSSV